MTTAEFFLFLFVLAIFVAGGWMWLLYSKIRELETEKHWMLDREFDRMKLIIERTYRSPEFGGGGPEVIINGEDYRRGDTILDPLYEDEPWGDNKSPFYISEIAEPGVGGKIWRLRVLDRETYGKFFDRTLEHDEATEQDEEDEDE